HDYAIVGQQSVTLLAQPGDWQGTLLNGKERNMLFELDTVMSFDSPFKKQTIINVLGLAKWEVNLLNEDDTVVYYWRTKFADPLPGELDSWAESSFTYIQGSPPGWAQSESGQLLKNEITGLEKKE